VNKNFFKISRGVTLIELLIALLISSILIAGIYRVFIYHQRTYTTQEQVADMQQNVRAAINKMIREIRMAGFGGKNENTNGNNDIINAFGNVNGFTNIINPENDVTEDGITHDRITVVAAYRQVGTLAANVNAGANSFSVNYTISGRLDNDKEKYVCLSGRHNYEIVPTAGNLITLAGVATLNENHLAGEPVFLVEAITYGLRKDKNGVPVLFRNSNTNPLSSPGNDIGKDSVAENIENLQFKYVLVCSPQPCVPPEVDSPLNPLDIRAIRVTITARTQMSDPQLKEGGGYRRRTINTYIDLRNLRDDSS
jgi:prepilin-type N-terminal cleavage/methylation domain-containing protein